jgi:CheY-like chemotaxis protein
LEQVKAIPDPSLILILSDINMPGMTGLEMLTKVKAARPNVPVIMITAYGDDATKKKSCRTGGCRAANQADRLWTVAPGNR